MSRSNCFGRSSIPCAVCSPADVTNKSAAFRDHVLCDLLAEVPRLHAQAMFTGWGVYAGPTIFAIIVGDELFLKGDPDEGRFFEGNGGRRFAYTRKTHPAPILMPYWSVPEAILEDRETLMDWVRRALKEAP